MHEGIAMPSIHPHPEFVEGQVNRSYSLYRQMRGYFYYPD